MTKAKKQPTAHAINPPLLEKDVDFRVEIEPEQESFEGICSAIGAEEDTERWIREQLAAGNECAWCCVMVDAEPHSAAHGDARGDASVGHCSYENRADMEELIADLRFEALADLNRKLEAERQLQVTLEISDEMVRDWLLIPALEGGSNYWLREEGFETRNDPGVSGGATYDLPFRDGCALLFCTGEAAWVRLDRAAVRRGLQLMATSVPYQWGRFLAETGDAETADVWLQLCLFGELLYA